MFALMRAQRCHPEVGSSREAQSPWYFCRQGKGWCGLLSDRMTYRSARVEARLWWLSRAPFILIIPSTPIQVITAAYWSASLWTSVAQKSDAPAKLDMRGGRGVRYFCYWAVQINRRDAVMSDLPRRWRKNLYPVRAHWHSELRNK